MNEQTHTTEETVSNEKDVEEIGKDSNAEQIESKENKPETGKTKSEQIDFGQMYDMLKQRDNTIEKQNKEIAELKKSNTELLLKVNAGTSSGEALKSPVESFIDSMVNR